jgi:segregation and condensation protein A
MAVESEGALLGLSLGSFDGPFDLLLSLIRRNQYAIDALPVLEITGQFLAYVRAAQEMDAELAGEFVEVASWLVLLKSRSLLPAERDKVAPHIELRRALLDHQTLAATTDFLRERSGKGRPGSAGARGGRTEGEIVVTEDAPTVKDVLEAARRALESAHAARSLDTANQESASVEELANWVTTRLAALPSSAGVSTKEWFTSQPSQDARAALLLALLELARNGRLLLHQEEDFAPIRVKSLGSVPTYPGPASALPYNW